MRVLVYGMVGTNRGGIETFLKKMSLFMSASTFFDYVIEGKECIHNEEIEKRGGRIYHITARNENPIANIRDNKELLKRLKNEIDVVYFNLSSLSWITPIIIAKHYGYRVCVHSHNSQFIDANSGIIYQVVNKLNKKLLHRMDVKRLTCSKPATEFMFEKTDHVEMIYNAIKTSQFTFNDETRKRIRNDFGISEKKVIGFVGRLSDPKNPLFLPDIMAEVIKIRKDSVMLIVGEGDLRPQVEEKIARLGLQGQCILLGNRTNVPELMQAMDVFILPSEHEGLPYVVVEAQTTGLRCIVSDAVTEEVNISGNVRFLPLSIGAKNWATEISKELEDPIIDREKMAEYMGATAFNIENEALRLEKILGS